MNVRTLAINQSINQSKIAATKRKSEVLSQQGAAGSDKQMLGYSEADVHRYTVITVHMLTLRIPIIIN